MALHFKDVKLLFQLPPVSSSLLRVRKLLLLHLKPQAELPHACVPVTFRDRQKLRWGPIGPPSFSITIGYFKHFHKHQYNRFDSNEQFCNVVLQNTLMPTFVEGDMIIYMNFQCRAHHLSSSKSKTFGSWFTLLSKHLLSSQGLQKSVDLTQLQTGGPHF